MNCDYAPFVMKIEVQHLLEPGETGAYLPASQGAWCSDRAPTFFKCSFLRQHDSHRIIYHHAYVPAGGPSWASWDRRAVSGAGGPPAGRAPAAPPLLALPLALVLARR